MVLGSKLLFFFKKAPAVIGNGGQGVFFQKKCT
jgi:hypothetical protein